MSWQNSKVAPEGTHHLDADKQPLYSHRFAWVLPFHPPGLAPAGDATGAYHIIEQGEPAYPQRYLRTFGFYEGRAAVKAQEGWFHILPDGAPLYSQRWAWCGNYQNGRCPIRTHNGDYYHLQLDGSTVSGGPWAYAGDYREGAAVVRDRKGLCHYVDEDGNFLYPKAYFDLDVFHKGFARARDGEGWFHIDRRGNDVSGRRYEQLEPFYNGQALAQTKNGRRVIIDEQGQVRRILPLSEAEAKARLHLMAVAYWVPFAVKLGLDFGLAEGGVPERLPQRAEEALRRAWVELGLLEADKATLTTLGQRITPGTIERDRFDYWLGPQLGPWLEGKTNLTSAEVPDFFATFADDQASAALVQRVLDSYAAEDWAGIEQVLDLEGVVTVVDLGGGRGQLLSQIVSHYPQIRGVLLERQEVVELMSKERGFEIVAGDLFMGPLPSGELYILSRVLHDWSDERVLQLLRHISTEAPKKARICVIERLANNGRHGLLDLNMYLVNRGGERSLEEWEKLFKDGQWKLIECRMHNDHSLMYLKRCVNND